ncbi:Helitron helicase [Phytophthora megakarya]|uniref:Helitron helicase n=1 Tax=Phytophthora megakarya TaxID=4795 RepID=A0A225ULF2_9STRA|nr:Helitron helicase [Phytophthora megakarya]
MGDQQRQEVQERDATTTRASRHTMTLDERLELREEEWFRSRSRQYKKGYYYHEDFVPTIIRGKDTVDNRHYISRFLRSGEERRCAECGGWKLDYHPAVKLLESYDSSIRAYNNGSAFTSIGATRSEPLRVDESVTRRGIYNFRVMGTVCHRMGSLLPPPGGKRMFAQIYINDPDSAARVASRIRMTDGLSAEFLSDIWMKLWSSTTLTPNSSCTHAKSVLSAVDQPCRQLEQNVYDAKKKNTRKMNKDMKRIATKMVMCTRGLSILKLTVNFVFMLAMERTQGHTTHQPLPR